MNYLDKLKHLNQPHDTGPIVPTVSALSVPDLEDSATNSHPHEGETVKVAPPTPPLRPGWLVAYRDRRGTLCGGCDDRTHGTVQACRWDEKGWTVQLTDGQRLPLSIIRSVGRTESTGQIVAAWTVREHGYDGEGPITRGGQH